MGKGLSGLFLFFGESVAVIIGLLGSSGDLFLSRTKLYPIVNIDSAKI